MSISRSIVVTAMNWSLQGMTSNVSRQRRPFSAGRCTR
jgi:hypothetical protein